MNKKLNKLNERPELAKSEIVKGMPKVCSDETAAVEFFEAQRWGDSPSCPHCQSKDVYQIKGRDGARSKRYLWRCRACGEQYTVRIGTVYEDSRLPLRHWAYAFWRACTSKKGVSALEIQHQCQISYKSALFLMHRIRFAMNDDSPKAPKLYGEIEIDETYCGGMPRMQNDGKRAQGTGYRPGTNKIPVVAMIKRRGEVRAEVVPCVNGKNLSQFINKNIVKGSTVHTDQHPLYKSVLYPLTRFGTGKHVVVNHTRKEYARHNRDGTVAHVNTCESFFSLLKRGLMGTFHCVSKEHLHRYCDEFAFRWNTRTLNDGDRVVAAIKGADGKRLLYSDAVAA
jgi:transposase-like protein